MTSGSQAVAKKDPPTGREDLGVLFNGLSAADKALVLRFRGA